MLKGIDPALSGDILHALDAMGHGDDLILTDTNFPAEALARQSTWGHLLNMANLDASRCVEAVLSVLPLDTFVDAPAATMAVVDEPDAVLPVHEDVQKVVRASDNRQLTLQKLERFAFYERAGKAFCIIRTGEGRFYGNFILRKGVIPPNG